MRHSFLPAGGMVFTPFQVVATSLWAGSAAEMTGFQYDILILGRSRPALRYPHFSKLLGSSEVVTYQTLFRVVEGRE